MADKEKNIQMNVGILGLALRPPFKKDGNLGCYALAYSFFEVINQIAEKEKFNIRIVYIQRTTFPNYLKQKVKKILHGKDEMMNYYTKLYSRLSFSRGYCFAISENLLFSKAVRNCKCVFDFTAGDSFTDIYGEERFYIRTKLKKAIIDRNIPLILGSQTIGPFNDKDVERFAVEVIEKCKYVYVRDAQSKKYVESISSVKPVLTTDIAFFLPFEKQIVSGCNLKFGFNPSGLLWNGGYNQSNQFGLRVNYQEFCRAVIHETLNRGWEVHLILHCYSIEERKGKYSADNDRIAVEVLHDEFPQTIVSPFFSTPMSAKSYISGMNLFMGARMHATIAALSAEVPVFAFSYSRKFEGLFYSLNYPYVIEATKWSTQEALNKVKFWTERIDEIRDVVSKCNQLIKEKNVFLMNSLNGIISSYKNEKINNN